MPIIKSAKKAARQAEKRTEHNVEIKKAIKAALKAFKANPTPQTLAKAQSEYDKAVKKNLMKKNKWFINQDLCYNKLDFHHLLHFS